MKSLILKTRLNVLHSTLNQVKLVLDAAKHGREEIDQLKGLLFGRDGVDSFARKVKTQIELTTVHLGSHLGSHPDDQDDSSENVVNASSENVVNALKEIKRTEDHLLQLARKLAESSKALDSILRRRVELGKLTEVAVQDRFMEKAVEGTTKLDKLLAKLDDQVPSASAADLRTAWEDYEQRLCGQSEPLFAEYVDLLHGLALRESGLEMDICQLADRLLEGCDRVAGAFHWRSVAIPAHRGPVDSTPAHIIRLGFPEWTIWALPLAAYEFGRIMVTEHQELREHIQGALQSSLEPVAETESPPEPALVLEDILADAFATYTAGPAYACAAILMRFNPRPSAMKGGYPADWERAGVVFGMLAKADKNAGVGASFKEVRTRLEEAWNEAVAQTDAGPTDEERSRRPAQERKEREDNRLIRVVDSFWAWAEQNSITGKYPPSSWMMAKEWSEKLLSLLENEDAIVPKGDDVRDVLNASWLCRLNNPEKAEEIAGAARHLWEKMRVKPNHRGGPTAGTQREPVTPGVQRTERF